MWDMQGPQGRFMKNQNFKYLSLSEFDRFYDVHKENMFTTNLEDGREAHSKDSKINQFNTIC